MTTDNSGTPDPRAHPPVNWWEAMAELRVNHATCATRTDERLTALEGWRLEQIEELRSIRKKTTGILVSIILLLIGVLANLIVETTRPEIETVVASQIEEQIEPIVSSVVDHVLQGFNPSD